VVDGLEKGIARPKVTVQGSRSDARVFGNVVQAGVCAVPCERLLGDLQNALAIPLGIGAQLMRGGWERFVGIKKM
jgi:hypothetical protein